MTFHECWKSENDSCVTPYIFEIRNHAIHIKKKIKNKKNKKFHTRIYIHTRITASRYITNFGKAKTYSCVTTHNFELRNCDISVIYIFICIHISYHFFEIQGAGQLLRGPPLDLLKN